MSDNTRLSNQATTHDGVARSLVRLLSCIRLDEVVVLQGTPLLGALFAVHTLSWRAAIHVLMLALASGFLVAHVFVLNDWSGAATDIHDPNRADRVFTAKGVDARAVIVLSLILLCLSLLLLIPFGTVPVLLALLVAALSALYSLPGLALKGVPLASSLLHLIGGLAHFMLGYSIFRQPDMHALGIGSYFALTFVAGHLTHEARDYVSDRLNQIRTNAVRYGAAANFIAGFVLFTLANLLLMGLALGGVVPRWALLIGLAYPLHLTWVLRTWRAGLNFDSIRQLQHHYRALYALIGVFLAVVSRLSK